FVGVDRFDNDFDLPGDNCDTSFTAPVAYQTQWAIVTADSQNWIELGTGHKCQNYRFWYWGYSYQGTWNPLGTQAVPVGSHNFTVGRVWNGGNPIWYWSIDGNTKNAIYWNTGADHVDAGLETYETNAVVAPHGYQYLRWAIYDQGGQFWTGRDATVVNGGLCGRWEADNDWRASQNWGSC
ncbi:MAG: hypothetical protein ACRDRT_09925, partial [Pseudonocardiaceae bacterium]